MNLTADEMESLKKAKNATEWNAACDAIKRARSNQYPPDWWEKVMQSGLHQAVVAGW